MALPDTLERVGVVAGSVLLLALPTSALASLLFAPGSRPPPVSYLTVAPGFLVGLAVATDRLPVTYHQIWQFSIASWLVAALGAAALGVGRPSSGAVVAVGWWLVSVAVGAAVARVEVRESLAAAVR